MLLTITPLYAGLLGLWYLALTFRVVRGRLQQQISLGDGGDASMNRRIRGHANFGEYVPLVLLMMGFLEIGGAVATWVLHALGLALLLARVLHGLALSFSHYWQAGRMGGATLTFLTLAAASLLCLWRGIASMLLS